MKIYIAGKITGNVDYKQQFAELERRIYDAAEESNIDVSVLNPASLPEGMSRNEYMRICFQMIDISDCVFFIDGWVESDGARLENDYCEYIGKSTYRASAGVDMIRCCGYTLKEESVGDILGEALVSAAETLNRACECLSERISAALEHIGGTEHGEK